MWNIGGNLKPMSMCIVGAMIFKEVSQVADDAVGSIRTIASLYAEENVIELIIQKEMLRPYEDRDKAKAW